MLRQLALAHWQTHSLFATQTRDRIMFGQSHCFLLFLPNKIALLRRNRVFQRLSETEVPRTRRSTQTRVRGEAGERKRIRGYFGFRESLKYLLPRTCASRQIFRGRNRYATLLSSNLLCWMVFAGIRESLTAMAVVCRVPNRRRSSEATYPTSGVEFRRVTKGYITF